MTKLEKFTMTCFIVSALLLFCTNIVFAKGSYQVPKDAVIKVFDANGKQIGEMSRSEYKVVKLGTSKPETKKQKQDREYSEKHNSIIVHVGSGNDGMRVSNNGSEWSVKEKRKPVFGATYCYTENGAGICATGMTNKTYTLGIKKDF